MSVFRIPFLRSYYGKCRKNSCSGKYRLKTPGTERGILQCGSQAGCQPTCLLFQPACIALNHVKGLVQSHANGVGKDLE